MSYLFIVQRTFHTFSDVFFVLILREDDPKDGGVIVIEDDE